MAAQPATEVDEEMSKRAERRANRERMKAKARAIWPRHNPGKVADNLAICSCWMCGNARRYEGPTMQERRAMFTLEGEL